MKEYLKLAGALFIIAGIASGVLAFVNEKTSPIIEKNQQKIQVEARASVLPFATKFKKEKKDDFEYYLGLNDANEVMGYTFIAYGDGYSSTIQTMVGLKKDLSINKIKIIYQSETPGLGANSESPEFQNQFEGLSSNSLKVDKDGGDIVSITGATITSRAITNSIAKKS